MCAAPVGQNEALVIPLLLQNVREEIFVFAGVVAIHAIVGTHHGRWIRFERADLEGEQIALAHGPLVDVYVNRVAAAFLIVQRIVLDVSKHMLRLSSLDQLSHHAAGQDRVFTHVLKRSPIAWLPREIDAAAERHVVALVAEFAPDESSVLISGFQIPACCCAQIRRQRSGIAAVLTALPDAVGSIGHLDIGNSEPRNSDSIARTSVGMNVKRTQRSEALHSGAMEERYFFV